MQHSPQKLDPEQKLEASVRETKNKTKQKTEQTNKQKPNQPNKQQQQKNPNLLKEEEKEMEIFLSSCASTPLQSMGNEKVLHLK